MAVLSVQLSARYVQIRQTAKIRNTTKYYALADITLLRFDVSAFAHTYTCCARYGYQEIESERYRNRDVELFCSTPCVYTMVPAAGATEN